MPRPIPVIPDGPGAARPAMTRAGTSPLADDRKGNGATPCFRTWRKNFRCTRNTLSESAGDATGIARWIRWAAATAPPARSTRSSCSARIGTPGATGESPRPPGKKRRKSRRKPRRTRRRNERCRRRDAGVPLADFPRRRQYRTTAWTIRVATGLLRKKYWMARPDADASWSSRTSFSASEQIVPFRRISTRPAWT